MFRKWLEKEGLTTSRGHTHLMMDGGKFNTSQHEDTYKEKYIEALNNGETLFVVEQKTKVFNFMVDVDYKDDKELDINEVIYMCDVIVKKVHNTTRHNGSVLISLSEPKNVDKNLIKSGIHMNWPGLKIDSTNAINLRSYIVDALEKVLSGTRDWKSIIDERVYKGSGLRIPWSKKRVPCVLCKQGSLCNLDNCVNAMKTEGAYFPFYIMHPTKTRIDVMGSKPSVKLLSMASVREIDNTQKSVLVNPISDVPHNCGESFVNSNSIVEMKKDDSLMEEFSKFISGEMRYDKLKIYSILQQKSEKKGSVLYLKTYSSQCFNLDKSKGKTKHSSEHIWFIVRKGKEIAQKCFCQCQTVENRLFGHCSKYEGDTYNLPYSISSKLEEEETEEEKTEEGSSFIKRYMEILEQ